MRAELAKAETATACQRVARRHEGRQAIAEQRLGDHVRVGTDQTPDAEVHLVALDEVDEARRHGIADADDDPVVVRAATACGRTPAATDGSAPTVTVPRWCVERSRACWMTAVTSAEMRSNGATRSRPACVRATRRLLRSKSRTPSAASSWRSGR